MENISTNRPESGERPEGNFPLGQTGENLPNWNPDVKKTVNRLLVILGIASLCGLGVLFNEIAKLP